MDFGDYCYIEQKRHGAPNEMYQHKVIGRLRSNTWVDVPVQSPATETLHEKIVDVIACICCGVSEHEVRRYRESDCRPTPETRPEYVGNPCICVERLALQANPDCPIHGVDAMQETGGDDVPR